MNVWQLLKNIIDGLKVFLYFINYKNIHSILILVVRFSPDGKYVASAGLDRKIFIWETKALTLGKVSLCYKLIEDHTDYILDLVFGSSKKEC